MCYFPFEIWLISFSILISNSFCFVANFRDYSFSYGLAKFHHVYKSHFFSLVTSWWKSLFISYLTIRKLASINTRIQLTLSYAAFITFGYIPWQRWQGPTVELFSIYQGCPILSLRMVIYIPASNFLRHRCLYMFSSIFVLFYFFWIFGWW